MIWHRRLLLIEKETFLLTLILEWIKATKLFIKRTFWYFIIFVAFSIRQNLIMAKNNSCKLNEFLMNWIFNGLWNFLEFSPVRQESVIRIYLDKFFRKNIYWNRLSCHFQNVYELLDSICLLFYNYFVFQLNMSTVFGRILISTYSFFQIKQQFVHSYYSFGLVFSFCFLKVFFTFGVIF
jgi:hypothetical protein